MTPLTVTENIKTKSRIFQKIDHWRQNALLKCSEYFDKKTLKIAKKPEKGCYCVYCIENVLFFLTKVLLFICFVNQKGLPSDICRGTGGKNWQNWEITYFLSEKCTEYTVWARKWPDIVLNFTWETYRVKKFKTQVSKIDKTEKISKIVLNLRKVYENAVWVTSKGFFMVNTSNVLFQLAQCEKEEIQIYFKSQKSADRHKYARRS